MQCFVYCRVSTEEQASDNHYSLNNQEQKARDYAKLKDWNVSQVQQDVASGKDSARHGFRELISAIKNGKVGCVLVYRLDRLSRNVRDVYDFLELIKTHKVGFVSISENFDTTTAMGRAMLGVAAVFAQLTREMIAENVKDGLMRRAQSGLYTGNQRGPYGYRYDKAIKNLVVDPESAEIVREIFTLYAERKWGVRKISSYLNEKSIPGKEGGQWSIDTVCGILRQPAYIGKIRWHDQVYEGVHESIVSQELWDAAQEMIVFKRKMPARTHQSEHLLSGIAECGTCGKKLTAHHGPARKDGTRYISYSHYVGVRRDSCKSFYRSAVKLERLVIDEIRRAAQSGVLEKLGTGELERQMEITGDSKTHFSYDDDANRVKMVTKNGEVCYFVYDPTASVPAVVYEERGTDTGGAGKRYINVRNPGGALISRERYNSSGVKEAEYTYHFDGLGSTLALTDSTGAIIDKYSYDAWGNVTHTQGSTADNPYQYVGELGYYTHYQEGFNSTGKPNLSLLQLGVRYYDPSTGRFTQQDPIGDGLNWYGYADGNPMGWVDPWGLSRQYFDPVFHLRKPGEQPTKGGVFGVHGNYGVDYSYVPPPAKWDILTELRTADALRLIAFVQRKRGLKLTSGFLKHWQVGSGAPVRVDLGALIRQNTAMAQEHALFVRRAKEFCSSLQPSRNLYPIISNVVNSEAKPNPECGSGIMNTDDVYNSINGYNAWAEASVHILIGRDGKKKAQMRIIYHLWDIYQWNSAAGVQDSVLDGCGRDFMVTGEVEEWLFFDVPAK